MVATRNEGKRVLIVDDEASIGQALRAYLEREGFTVATAETLQSALAEYRKAPPDMLILDITLPDGSGLDVLRAAADDGRRTPAIMLTARADEVDRVVGLELGADDYVTKPFSPREVVARVRAVMRRTAETAAATPRHGDDRIVVDALQIDVRAHEVYVGGREVELTPTEFRILRVLAEHPGQTFTRSSLLDALHDDGSIFERTLDRHVNNVRKKIEPDPEHPTYLQTVYGVGYKMKVRGS